MSARRQARARMPALERLPSSSAVPAAFLVGRCIEVWAEPNAESRSASTMRRFNAARNAWAKSVGADNAEMRELIPNGSPWSVDFLSYRGQAERVGRPLTELVAERLGAAGCDLSDLPALAKEADALYAGALGGSLGRAYGRSRKGGRA